jgi:hypothetical protein
MGKAGAGSWFRKRSTAVGSLSRFCVFERASPGIAGGKGGGRGASNHGLFGSWSGEFASVIGTSLLFTMWCGVSNEGALCLDTGSNGFCAAGSLKVSNLPLGADLLIYVPADVVGRCSSGLLL